EALSDAIDRWMGPGTPSTSAPPDSVVQLALYQQRIYGVMVARPALARGTIALLPRSLAGQAKANSRAGAALSSITGPIGKHAPFMPKTARLRTWTPSCSSRGRWNETREAITPTTTGRFSSGPCQECVA